MARKVLTNLDLNLNQLLNALAQVLGSDPSVTEGRVFYHSGTGTLRFGNATSYVVLGRLDQISAPTAAVSLNSQRLTNLGTPTAGTDAATRSYVDALAAGMAWKDKVRAATTAPLTLATGLENGDEVDGVTLATGDRVLVKDQASGAENGIYVVAASGAPARATDADSLADLAGATTVVTEGGTNAGAVWHLQTDAVTPGTTAQVWVQIGAGVMPTAGAGLTLTGSTLDVNVDGTTIEIVGDDLQVVDAVANQLGVLVVGEGDNAGLRRLHAVDNGTALGGYIDMDDAPSATVGGTVTVTGGSADFDDGTGGAGVFEGGIAAQGGQVQVVAGSSQGDYDGAGATVEGGTATQTGRTGGTARLQGGLGGSAGTTGGEARMTGGFSQGSGSPAVFITEGPNATTGHGLIEAKTNNSTGSSGQALVSNGSGKVVWGAVYLPGGTDVPVADGGTGASDAATARTNLGVTAGNVPFTPAGSIAATTVQAAIEEVASEAGGGGGPDLGAAVARTIASGVIDVAGENYVIVDGEGSADDVLDEITGGVDGQVVVLESAGPTIKMGFGTNTEPSDQERGGFDAYQLGNYVQQVIAVYSDTKSMWELWADQAPRSIMATDGATEILAYPADSGSPNALAFLTDAETVLLMHKPVAGAAEIGFFGRADLALTAEQQAASTVADLWAALKNYGLLTSGSTAPGAGVAKYAETIGDGADTSIVVTHDLGTEDVVVQVRELATDDVVECDIDITSADTVTLGFTAAPATDALRVVVIG